METHITSFNESIRVWKQVMDQSGSKDSKSISSLLNKAHTEYQSLLSRKKWPKLASPKSDPDAITKKRKAEPTDILSLLAQSRKETKSMIQAMMAKTSQPSGPTPRLRKTTAWSWEAQYGRGKDFADSKEFLLWLHTEPDVITGSVKKNGVKWYWCTKCVRFTSHKSAECTRKSVRQIKASANLASASKPSPQSDSDSDESEIYTESFEEEQPTKKMRRSKK